MDEEQAISSPEVRHVACLSGGKDSTALAIYMRDRVPDMEYVFTDTGKELPETYEYLQRVEAFLGKPLVRLNSERDFDHWLTMYGNYLPSTRMRWCTRMLKIRPLERYLGEGPTRMYIGLRADEDRQGYISSKPNITPVYPFKEDGIQKDDVMRILEEAGIGLPAYYKWRTRSGCYFCFFQRKSEWVGLMREHPELFEAAKAYEKLDPVTGKRFTWNDDESLDELAQSGRVDSILQKGVRPGSRSSPASPNSRLIHILGDTPPDEDDAPCTICHL